MSKDPTIHQKLDKIIDKLGDHGERLAKIDQRLDYTNSSIASNIEKIECNEKILNNHLQSTAEWMGGVNVKLGMAGVAGGSVGSIIFIALSHFGML